MALTLTILGCASSAGVPRVGGSSHAERWGACDATNLKNHRKRCSALLTRTGPGGTTTCVIDTGPDFRAQMLDANVSKLDGVIYTHEHADHLHGIDDMRPFALVQRARIPVHMDDRTFNRAMTAFGYVFETPPGSSYPPILDRRTIDHTAPVIVEGEGGTIELMPILVNHGDIDALGFKIGKTLYLPDVKAIPKSSRDHFNDLDCLIIDALRHKSHPSHFNLDDALAFQAEVKPGRTFLTNLHIDLDYETLMRETPESVEPAYDGLQITIST
ncbi:MAG: MBL fold metallo-hydrolase [Devosiaceae bacterium]